MTRRVRSAKGWRPWLTLAGIVMLAGLLIGLDLALTWWLHAPRIARLADENPSMTSYMRVAARQGHPPTERRWIPLDSISPIAVCAVVRSEDSEFFNIGTLNYDIQRQMLSRMLHGDFSRGGSGFAQQLARNLFLGPQRTPRRKIREYLLAYQLSHVLSKPRQLELYLNVVEWADGVWGIEAASQHYFDSPASRLGVSRSVILSSMLPAPRRGLPYAAVGPAARKMSAVTNGLGRTMLIDELTAGATLDRLGIWRARITAGENASEAEAAVDRIMGPEPAAQALRATDRRPIGEACNVRRRPG